MAFLALTKTLALSQTCLSLYHKFQTPQGPITTTRRRIEHIRVNLLALSSLLSHRSNIASLQPDLTTHMKSLIIQTETELLVVQKIFTRCDPSRQDFLSQLGNLFSNDTQKLEKVNQNLDFLCDAIHETVTSLGVAAMAECISAAGAEGDSRRLRRRPEFKAKSSQRAKAGGRGVTVIFVGGEKEETWAIIAAVYTRLLGSYVEGFGGKYWPVGECFPVTMGIGEGRGSGNLLRGERRESRLQLQLESQSDSQRGREGRSPNETALDVLFNDEYTERVPFRDVIRSSASTMQSSTFHEGVFEENDYIFAFDYKTLHLLERMRDAREAAQARDVTRRGSEGTGASIGTGARRSKAKLRLLGGYWPSPTSGREIFPVGEENSHIAEGEVEEDDSERTQMLWERRVSRIKVCVKLWLNREFGWTEPGWSESRRGSGGGMLEGDLRKMGDAWERGRVLELEDGR